MSESVPPQDRLAGLSREQRALLFEQIRRRKEKERAAAPPDGIPRRPPGLDPLPLSFAQERLWFIDRLRPGLSVYNMPLALRISGEPSPAIFAALLGEVVRRHEVLRTTFREADGQPVQVVAPAGGWTLPLVDLSALPAALRGTQAEALAQEESDRPFDLGRGPLLRAALLRLAPAEHALLMTMHHIVSDGWSMGVLVREITSLYGALAAGAPSPFPELPIQYADFAVWQRRWLAGEVLDRQLAYWRQRLAGAPASLDLPADRPRPAVPSHRGAEMSILLSAHLSRQLSQLARRQEATPFMVLLAAFLALLGRITGEDGHPGGLADRQPQPCRDRAADRLLRQYPGAARRPRRAIRPSAICSPRCGGRPWRRSPIRTSPSSSSWRSCSRSAHLAVNPLFQVHVRAAERAAEDASTCPAFSLRGVSISIPSRRISTSS